MNNLKNLNGNVQSLDSLIECKKYQVLSLALTNNTKYSDIRLFSLSNGEMIRNEKYEMDTIYLCLEGKIIINKEGIDYTLTQNDFLSVKMGEKSSISASSDAKIIQIMIGE